MNEVKIKATPAQSHLKIQYEGEELTIKELVDRLHKYKFLFRFWKEEADKSSKMVDELMKQLSDAQTVRHGRWIAEDEYYEDSIYICSACGHEFIIRAGDLESNELNYCPRCGAKMDGGKS